MDFMTTTVRSLAEQADQNDRDNGKHIQPAVQLIKIARAFGLTDEKIESFRQWRDLADFLCRQ